MEELIMKAKNGDKQAFTSIILLLKNDLYRIAKLRLSNEDDINDVVQDTVLIALKSLRNLKQAQYFKTWITKILINESNKVYAKKSRFNAVSFDEIEDGRGFNFSNIENIEETLDFNLICKKLKYEERTIIILYYLEDFTDKEIGKILNLKKNTVTTKRTRARQKLKKIIEGREQ